MSEGRAGVGLPAILEGGDGAGEARNPALRSAPRLGRGRLEEAAGEVAKRSVSENTTRSSRSDWESWEAFCCFHGFTPLPADPDAVRLYLTQLTQFAGRNGGKVKPRTAQRHLVAIAGAHRAQDIGFDTQHPVLRRTIDGIRRTFSARQEGAPALRHGDIAAICKTFRADVRSVRDKAIILLGFAGGFRRWNSSPSMSRISPTTKTASQLS